MDHTPEPRCDEPASRKIIAAQWGLFVGSTATVALTAAVLLTAGAVPAICIFAGGMAIMRALIWWVS